MTRPTLIHRAADLIVCLLIPPLIAHESVNEEGLSHRHDAVIVQTDAHSRHILNLQIETIPETTLALSQSLYGHLVTPGHALETYALPCSGRIRLHVKTAQAVRKGDILYTLSSPGYADQVVAVQSASANLDRCKQELQALQSRVANLTQAGVRNSELESQLTFKRAEEIRLQRDCQIAQTRLKSLAMDAEQVEENGLPALIVRAHADGVVHNVGIAQNSWAEQGAPVITMSDSNALEVVGALYAAEIPHISEVRVYLPLGRENVEMEGSWRVAEQVNATTQTRNIFFTPRSIPTSARAGQLCRMDIYDAPSEPGIVSIPDSAIVRIGTDDVVFIEIGEGKYAMMQVHAGESKRGMTPVAGLHPGQRIVVKGGYELKYSLPQAEGLKKAGHFHADGQFHEGDEEEEHHYDHEL